MLTSLSPADLALGTSPRSQPAADLVASVPTQVTHRRSPVLLTCRQQTPTPRHTHTQERLLHAPAKLISAGPTLPQVLGAPRAGPPPLQPHRLVPTPGCSVPSCPGKAEQI